MPTILKRILPVLLFGFLLADSSYAFLQYFHQPLDGDLSWNVVPHEVVWNILSDPFGWGALMEGHTYPNPNKFFSHLLYRSYLLEVPLLLQSVVSPAASPYLACALLKLLVHLSLLGLLARLVLGPSWRKPLALFAVACLIAPFFQSGQFKGHIGLVDSNITYVFFYGLPAVFLLLFAIPFVDWLAHGKQATLQGWQTSLLLLLAPVVCLSGPLNPGVVLVATSVLFLAWLTGNFNLKEFPRAHLLLLAWANLLSLYALYLGQFDSLTINNQLPVLEMYAKLPLGVWRQFTGKLAWPVLFAGLTFNYFLLQRLFPAANVRKSYRWVLLFAALYILLLPLGGFRSYRVGILRYDTILPITLSMISLYAATSWQLLRSLGWQRSKGYLVVVLLIAGVYINANDFQDEAYQCERSAIEEIAAAKTELVALESDCPVALWFTYPDPSYSTLNGRLFHYWGITDRPKQYYHPNSTGGR